MMSAQSNTPNILLEQLGLDSQEAEIYLYLVKNDNSSALDISRGLHLGRTTVYRILDRLQARGLVNQLTGELGLKFQTTAIENLDLLVLQKEQEVAALRRSVPALISQLDVIQAAKQQGSKVVYYKGEEGLKQVTWNSLQAKELLTYEVEIMESFLDEEFAEKMRLEYALRKIKIRELTNWNYFAPYTKHEELPNKWWQARYIPEAELKIEFEILIYNDVYAMYSYKDGEIFCVEIYNAQLAQMQRNLFEIIWKSAKPLKIIGPGGEAKVEE
jgi:predicted DNA-binding transcriptional regulator